jgi:tetratricopeptide (TPR) repeat protein
LLTIDDEKIEQVANKLLENIQEKLDKLEPPAFKKNMPTQARQESAQDRQRSQSEIWDEVEANWDKIDELTDDGEYDEVDKELDIILEIKFENISAWIKKGHNNISRGKYDDAIFCYNNALILDKKVNKKLDKKDYEILKTRMGLLTDEEIIKNDIDVITYSLNRKKKCVRLSRFTRFSQKARFGVCVQIPVPLVSRVRGPILET